MLMWVIVLALFGLMFLVEEKVKNRFLQPILFLILTLAIAHIFVYWERIAGALT